MEQINVKIGFDQWRGEAPEWCHPFFHPGGQVDHGAWPGTVEGTAEVAIIGAGLSGLTAAYELRHRDVVVLEAGAAPGGVCQPGSYRGVSYPAGSAYFYYPWDAAWEAWYRGLGVPLEEALVPQPFSAMWHEGRWFPDCFAAAGLAALPLSTAGREGFVALAGDLKVWEEEWEGLGSETISRPELDQMSLAYFLEVERGLPPEVTHLLSPYCRSCLGAAPEQLSAWAGLYFLMSEFSPHLTAAVFPEGNARLVQALVSALPRPPRVHQTVVALAKKGGGVELLVWDNAGRRPYRLQAGVAIVAVGKFAARHLLPEDSGWNQEIFQAFRYSSYVVAALCGPLTLTAPGYENWVVGEPLMSDFVMCPAAVYAESPRVMVVYAPQPYPAGRASLLKKAPQAMGQELVSTVERLFPGTAREVEEMHLYRFGHAQIVPYPGFMTFLKNQVPWYSGPIVLAHSDMEGLPCIEAAIVQGRKAAAQAEAVLAK